MPELPEVETIRRGLQATLPGLTVSSVEVILPKAFIGDPEKLEGLQVTSVERAGKLLLLHFGDWVVTVHLKMTGQLLYQPPKGEAVMGGHPDMRYMGLPGRVTRVIIYFEDGHTLYFNDMRTFGGMKVLPVLEVQHEKFLQRLAPEPHHEAFTEEYLWNLLQRRPKSILKGLLLDQAAIAGLGNIYADESCFRAGILPMRRAGSLSQEEAIRLFHAIRTTLDLALEHGGSSSRDYLNAVGAKGTYLDVAQVYHRHGKPCVVCGAPIQQVRCAGRSTHFCTNCQH